MDYGRENLLPAAYTGKHLAETGDREGGLANLQRDTARARFGDLLGNRLCGICALSEMTSQNGGNMNVRSAACATSVVLQRPRRGLSVATNTKVTSARYLPKWRWTRLWCIFQ